MLIPHLQMHIEIESDTLGRPNNFLICLSAILKKNQYLPALLDFLGAFSGYFYRKKISSHVNYFPRSCKNFIQKNVHMCERNPFYQFMFTLPP